MRFSQVAVALGAFASLSSALDADDVFTGSFSVDQVDIGRLRTRSVPHLMREAILKHNGTVTPELEAAIAASELAAKEHGSTTAINEPHDAEYLVPVSVGTPAQKLHLVLDTGSSDLWTFSGALPANQRKGHATYFPKKSKTSSRVKGASWKIKYGDGSSASGQVFRDKVTIAGLTVPHQTVEAASHAAAEFVKTRAIDGIAGFGFSSVNMVRPHKAFTFMQNILGRLSAPVLCADLAFHKPGSYDIGFINGKKHKGPIHYAPVLQDRGKYELFFLRTGGFSVGGKHHAHSFVGLADTGTSLIMADNTVVNAYYSQVKGAQLVSGVAVFPCDAKLPGFSVTIAGSQRSVPGKYLNYAFVGTSGGRRFCQGGIQPTTGISILGDVFLKSQYVVFDYGKKRIGFADKA